MLAALFVLVPLWLKSKSISVVGDELRKDQNIALFQERNDELEAELVAGNLDQEQFGALLVELQQSLLADVTEDRMTRDTGPKLASAGKTGKNSKASATVTEPSGLAFKLIPLCLTLLMPLLVYGLYNQWGYIEDVELMGLFQRTVDNSGDPQEAQSLVVSLGQIVQADDDKPWAWYFLAENFANLSMFTEAEIAYQQSADRLQDTPEKALVLGRVALAKYINSNLEFTPEIFEVIEQARAINPNEISALQLLAADAEQRQDYPSAISYWRLLIQSNPNSEQAQTLRANIAAAQQLMSQDGQDIAVGPVIEVNLSIAEGIELAADQRVFIAVRNAEREGMPPVAAVDLVVASLPTSIRLDNSSAVGPNNLSSAEVVYVSALVSFAGVAVPQSGDYRVVSENITHNGQHTVIDLVLADRVQ